MSIMPHHPHLLVIQFLSQAAAQCVSPPRSHGVASNITMCQPATITSLILTIITNMFLLSHSIHSNAVIAA
jgi:hypothetical protein